MDLQWLTNLTTVIKVDDYAKSGLISLAVLIGLLIFKNAIIRKLRNQAEKTSNKVDDALADIFVQLKTPLLILFAIYSGTFSFPLSDSIRNILSNIFQGAFILQILLVLQSFISLLFEAYLHSHQNKAKELRSIYTFISKFLIIVLWIIGVLIFLSNIGYDVSAVVASLGVGGLAIALAVQSILKDIFSAFMIIVNKPFEVGDWVKLSETEQGTIKKIGLKNTVIQTIANSELIVTNDDILNSRIYNFRHRSTRRVPITLYLDLDTKTAKIETFKQEIRQILESQELIDKESIKISVSEFTQQAIVISIVYFMLDNTYDIYMSTKDEVNLEIKVSMEKEKIKFAKSIITTT